MTTKEMSNFINSLWCWARCTEEEQRKLSEIADYLSNRGNEKNDCKSKVNAKQKMGITEHEAILKLKDITQVFNPEEREEIDQLFYNQLTLEDIRENLQDFNSVIGEIKRILREVEDGNDD
jgi:hypothetical protein